MHRKDVPDDAAQDPAAAGRDEHVRDLTAELGHLLELAVSAIPTTVGVSLVLLLGSAGEMTVSALRPGWHGSVLASLAVRLPRPRTWPAPGDRAELIIYAGTARAFNDSLPSLLALLDASSSNVTLDGHLQTPDLVAERAALARWLDEQSLLARAIGILLGQGVHPTDGRLELARRAAAAGTSTVEAARALIADTEAGRAPG